MGTKTEEDSGAQDVIKTPGQARSESGNESYCEYKKNIYRLFPFKTRSYAKLRFLPVQARLSRIPAIHKAGVPTLIPHNSLPDPQPGGNKK